MRCSHVKEEAMDVDDRCDQQHDTGAAKTETPTEEQPIYASELTSQQERRLAYRAWGQLGPGTY